MKNNMKKVAFITPLDARYGFSLAGIPQRTVEADGLEDALEKVMKDPENGLVVIDERLVSGGSEKDRFPEERLRELEQAWQGILLIIPSPEKPPGEVEDYAARMIRRAIGYHVRLKV